MSFDACDSMHRSVVARRWYARRITRDGSHGAVPTCSQPNRHDWSNSMIECPASHLTVCFEPKELLHHNLQSWHKVAGAESLSSTTQN